jgi:FkbM family methyltransferase
MLGHHARQAPEVLGTRLERMDPRAGLRRRQKIGRHPDIGADVEGIRFQIKIETLDDVPELKTRTDVHAIKIDVEEFEAEVLKGGMELIRRCRPLIFCEIWK